MFDPDHEARIQEIFVPQEVVDKILSEVLVEGKPVYTNWSFEAAKSVIKTLKGFGGFDGWWDDIGDWDQAIIIQDVAKTIREAAKENWKEGLKITKTYPTKPIFPPNSLVPAHQT